MAVHASDLGDIVPVVLSAHIAVGAVAVTGGKSAAGAVGDGVAELLAPPNPSATFAAIAAAPPMGQTTATAGGALGAGDGQRAQPSLLCERDNRRGIEHERIDVARHGIGDGRRRSLVGHVGEFAARGVDQQLDRQVWQAANSGRSHGKRSRL